MIANRPLDSNTQEFIEQAAASEFDFHTVSVKAAGDEKLKTAINNAVLRQYTGRQLRMLDLPDISQRRGGALVGIYRYIGKNLKVGGGYNFTDFSDELTDLKYNHRGIFVNLIGTK